MKKLFALILVAMLAFACVACQTAAPAPAAEKPAATQAPATEAPAVDTPAVTGKVYYLNFKPEADAAWQALAAQYTEKTGVPVTVVTAASGTYSETLTAEMDKGAAAPTLFQCGNKAGLDTWGDFCYDFTGTDVYKQMTTNDFNLFKDSGEVAAIGYCYECFGIIVNTALLEKAGHSLSEITDFASLKAVVEDIHKNAATLGFDAFTSSGLDGSSSWRFSGHLANMPLFYEFRDDGVTAQPASITGKYMENFKNIWDLYINNSATAPSQLATATGDQAEAEFGEGKAVFYQNGSWEFSNLTTKFAMSPDSLAMIPIYVGVDGESNAGLCAGTENMWAVNSKAAPEDIQATLDFLNWVVTSDEGTTMMAEQFGPIPFKNAKETTNVFFNDANKYLAEGKYVVTWAFNFTPNVDTWRAGVVAALTQYSAGGSWDDVVTAFVAGWATQYAAQ
ncbi:MAG TPA: ABC transporter substrate-binding protein [Clostridia bacterium]|jgi:raffinose/stachyose/melibiose transport system substrate-binding protein|nr:ABC transporter substrate-binding protein [Clostridia bacterium]